MGDIHTMPLKLLFLCTRRVLQGFPLFRDLITHRDCAVCLEKCQAHGTSQPTGAASYQHHFSIHLRGHSPPPHASYAGRNSTSHLVEQDNESAPRQNKAFSVTLYWPCDCAFQ